jgi:hypothetical protein
MTHRFRAFGSLVLLMALLLLAPGSRAAWWEFGRTDGEPVILDLKFNRVDVVRAEDRVVLGREDLVNGVLTLRGRAEALRGLIGLVEFSLDGGRKWTPATLDERGAFTSEMRLDLDREYDFRIRAITTTGLKTDEQEHSFLLKVMASNPQDEVRRAFQQLLQAYMQENRVAFMRLVSADFEGNESALEDAITDDFRYLDNIRIEPQISRVAQFDRSYEVSFTFNRQVTSTRSGQVLRDSAASTVSFVREGDGFKLSRMAAPLIFGLSGASEVATSVTTQSAGTTVISIHPDTGAATTAALGNSVPGSSSSVESGSAVLFASNNPCTAFAFDGGDTFAGQNCLGAFPDGDFRIEFNLMFLRTGNQAQLLGSTFNSTTQVPATGYGAGPFGGPLAVGSVYAFQLLGGKYALLEITSVSPATGGQNFRIRYKFQPNGSRNF